MLAIYPAVEVARMRRQVLVIVTGLIVGAATLGAFGIGELDSSWRTTVMNSYGVTGINMSVLALQWQDEFYAANLSVYTLNATLAY